VYDGQKLLLIVVKLIGRLIVSLLSTNIKLLYTSFDLLTGRLLMMYDILLQHLFLCYSSCAKSVVGFFLYDWCEHHVISKFNNDYFTRQIF